MNDRIEKQIELKAPVERVWRAITDYRQFGEWFMVKLDGPFEPGALSHGWITNPGYEHLEWNAVVQTIEPQRLFSYTWHPYSIEPGKDYSAEEQTLVEFRLEATQGGTLLRLTESGFDRIPAERRAEAWRMHDGGWAGQMQNIARYVEAAAG